MFKIEFTPWIEAAHLEQAEVQPYVSETYARMQKVFQDNMAEAMGCTPEYLEGQQQTTTTAECVRQSISEVSCVITKGHSVGPSTGFYSSPYRCLKTTILAGKIHSIINYRGA